MICESSVLPSYFSIKSFAPEKAIWLMYFTISSSVIPIPLSLIVIVPASLSRTTSIFHSVLSISASPTEISFLSLLIASLAFDTISLIKMSFSEYSHFLIIGNIFSVLIDTLPLVYSIFLILLKMNKNIDFHNFILN